ncbi:MAG TPA: hydantoinase B/oxoprolinase family protein [Ktedonobacterales bacterium]
MGTSQQPGPDPIIVEVIRNALLYASEEMGIVVRNASFSPNIKERLDHSCALFDERGRLIAQAEHIPVHLGSLPVGISNTLAYLERHGQRLDAGDMIVVNNPYIAGTHLNDITLIRPIYYEQHLVGYAASKAHHTDVGGRVPGSISSDATEVFQEGLILPPVKLMVGARFQQDIADIICANSRTPASRMGDLRAQVAGNLRGELHLQEVIARYGLPIFRAAVNRILDESEIRLRHQLAGFPAGRYEAEDYLDDSGQSDTPVRLKVTLTLADGAISVDYTGTDAQVQAPVNAVFGVTLSAVYYVLRSVTDHTIPMNEGCFRPVTVSAPEGTLLNPRFPAPVAGGNVETSMRNADVLLQAFAKVAPERVPACGGGTMTNLMVGGDDWAFYETIGVGMGGRPGLDGIDGIQTNMTNTLNTPIEAMERHFPIRMTHYEFRENSGGQGQWRGGCGLVRGFALLTDRATVTLLGDRARFAPPGAQGGQPGRTGERTLLRHNDHQTHVPLPAKTTFLMRQGDELIIQTPGGGGFGSPAQRDLDQIAHDRESGLSTLS